MKIRLSKEFKIILGILFVIGIWIFSLTQFKVWEWFRILLFIGMGIEGCRRFCYKWREGKMPSKLMLTLAILCIITSILLIFGAYVFIPYDLISASQQQENLLQRYLFSLSMIVESFTYLTCILLFISFIYNYPGFYYKTKSKVLMISGWTLLVLFIALFINIVRTNLVIFGIR